MIASLSELWCYRELLRRWIVREVSVRYKQSLLGIAWAVLQPLAFTIIFTVIFSYVIRVPTDGAPYPVFAFSALLPWTFLTTSITNGVAILVSNMNLVTKVYFPREVLPLASIAAAGVDFLIASVVFAGMMVYYRLPLHPAIVLLPLIVLIQILLIVGVVLLGSAAMVFFRDIRFVVPLGLQLWMYASPIIYPTSMIASLSGRLVFFYRLNPVVGLVESYRDILVYSRWPEAMPLAGSAVTSLGLFLVGFLVFKHLEPRFADVI